MTNHPEPGGCLRLINLLGRGALALLMGWWDTTLDKNALKYTLFVGSLLVGGVFGAVTLTMLRFAPFYPIDILKPQSRETKLFVCFIVIPATFIILCFAIKGIREKIASESPSQSG